MPRPASAAFSSAANALTTSEAFLALLTIRYPPTGETYRVVNDLHDVVSRGETFTAYPFKLTLPIESGEEIGVADLEIDNVELILINMLRQATTAIRVDIEVILSSDPDQVEISIPDLALRSCDWDSQTIKAKLANEDLLSKGFPPDLYNPQEYQGIFG